MNKKAQQSNYYIIQKKTYCLKILCFESNFKFSAYFADFCMAKNGKIESEKNSTWYIQRIQVECLTASVVAFVVTVELICVARQNDRRC